ncbi:hypothetical protein [Reichenbachiella sp.]|uniref:hypothetical protein n=1 Tax=Reichenbachiella sp. TaxID=2184521 RepID=UPI003B5AFDA5
MKNHIYINRTKSLLGLLSLVVILSACVTGVDDNVVLKEHNAWLATTPRVTDMVVNGVEVGRDSISVWEDVIVNAGDVVSITATFNTGEGANESTYTIVRNYYGRHFAQEGNQIVEGLADSVFTYGTGSNQFSLDYTVPAQDDDGFDFDHDNIITISFRSLNDIGSASYTDVTLAFE